MPDDTPLYVSADLLDMLKAPSADGAVGFPRADPDWDGDLHLRCFDLEPARLLQRQAPRAGGSAADDNAL